MFQIHAAKIRENKNILVWMGIYICNSGFFWEEEAGIQITVTLKRISSQFVKITDRPVFILCSYAIHILCS